MATTSGSFYWRGVTTGLVYAWLGPYVPPQLVDPYGNPLESVSNFTTPDGVMQTMIGCLPYGGVRQGSAGPGFVPESYNPGRIDSPQEEAPEPGI